MNDSQLWGMEEAGTIRELSVIKADGEQVHIILIPGIDTTPCDSWSICRTPWTEVLGQLDAAVTIHCYDHDIPRDDHFDWEPLLSEGFKLLAALQLFLTRLKTPKPLLFICHGLGGAILKQALCIAGVHYERDSQLLNSIAGLVFLGTPHGLDGVTNEQFGTRLLSILKLQNGSPLSRQCLTKLRNDAGKMLDLADRFRRTNLRVDILSIYEEKVTRIKDTALMSKTKRIIIVDEELCAIDIEKEQRLGVELNHEELVLMTDDVGSPIEPLKHWLASVINAAPSSIKKSLYSDDLSRAHSASSGTSIRSIGIDQTRPVADLALQKTRTVSVSHASTYVNIGSAPHAELQSLLENFSVKTADPRIPCFMVDTFVKNKSFFGREDILKTLDESLLPSKDLLVSSQPDRIRVGLLCGMGGLGKTETAIEYAYSRRKAFDAIFWIRAEDSIKLESDLAQIAKRLGIQDPNEPDDKVINRGLAMEWLCSPFKVEHTPDNTIQTRASWLSIFDNADEPDILAPYQDIANSGAVLITSRSPLAKSAFSAYTQTIDIRPFDRNEAGEFIQAISGTRDHLEEACQVGERLGGLPLALAQMAGIIRLEFLSYAEFLEIYNDTEEEESIHGTVLQPLRATARGNLSTVWALDRLSPSARAILEFSSFLDPDCIQESVLRGHSDRVTIPSYPTKLHPFLGARKELKGSSLFRHNPEKAEYWMHRVTQDVVRGKMDQAARQNAMISAIRVMTAAWPAKVVGGHAITLWNLSEKLFPHIAGLRDLYTRYSLHGDNDVNVGLANLLTRAAWYQHERGESYKVRPLLAMALDLCHRSTGTDMRDLESDIHFVLGAAATETNDSASCVENTNKFLEIRLSISAEKQESDEKLALAQMEVGIGWMMAKDYKRGETAFETARKTYETASNYDIDGRSLSLVNLGLAYWLQGHLDKAEEVLRLGIAEREERYGPLDSHSFRTGRFYHALGNVLYSQGKISESEDTHYKALRQYQSTIRNRHHRTADVCHKVAQHCLRKGLFNESLGFIDQALRVWSASPAQYAPEIARTTYLKAKVLSLDGEEEKANSLFQTAKSMRGKLTSDPPRNGDQLEEEDFDELVTFWSR